MKTRQPEGALRGPFPIADDDIPALNRLFSDAFTERYRRDGLVGVRVPPLNPAVWTYALRLAADGAMVWRDERGEMLAFNVAHRSGAEGWMGPLAVRPDHQGLGLGRTIVEAAVERLRSVGVTTLGLETMPRTVDNIGFYSRLGFVPGCLTITVGRDVGSRAARGVTAPRYSEGSEAERAQLLQRCRAALDVIAPGYDFSREIELTTALDLGDTVILEQGGAVVGFGMYHSAPLAESRGGEEVRLLKVVAASATDFDAVVRAVEACAARLGLGRIAVRCQTRFTSTYRALTQRGYQVRWTDLRMTLAGFDEPTLPEGAVVFSNWEI
jgi:GNAT superfamily N-acetyltransferase